MKNWITTVFGILLAGSTWAATNTTGKTQAIAQAIAAVGAIGLGGAAADSNKGSK
jgi:hypothetical protein